MLLLLVSSSSIHQDDVPVIPSGLTNFGKGAFGAVAKLLIQPVLAVVGIIIGEIHLCDQPVAFALHIEMDVRGSPADRGIIGRRLGCRYSPIAIGPVRTEANP